EGHTQQATFGELEDSGPPLSHEQTQAVLSHTPVDNSFTPAKQQDEDEEPVMYSEWELLGDGAAQWIMTAAAIVATILSWRAVRLLKGTLATNEELLRQGSKMHEESERAARAAENSNAIAREVGEAPVRAYPRID